ncbi:MAG: ATP synthase F1 subunit epsilon [Bacteroidales bacterium]|jgi:F-type H+-transporting ATPase subunit epsilon
MKLIILQPDKTIFNGEVVSVSLPGKSGNFTILNKHAPLISSLDTGKIKYRVKNDGNVEELSIKGGFIKVRNNIVTICIDKI